MNVPVVAMLSVPPERLIGPRFTVLLALADTAPLPVSTVPAKACVKASLRFNRKSPPAGASTLELLTEPTVLPELICSTPAITLVVPV
jgi:hypothetical protein